MNIDELEEIRSSVLSELKSIEGDIRDYWLDFHKENHGIYVGAIVKTTTGNLGVTSSVEASKAPRNGKPWIQARLYKNNGEPSKSVRNLFDGWSLSED